MGSNIVQLSSTALIFVGTLLTIFATVNNQWAKSDVSGNVLEAVKRSWGLWMRCQHLNTGLNTCDHYDKLILGSPTELILSRAFMCLGILFGIISILMSLLGADCSTLIHGAAKKKKTRCIAGSLGLTGGILVLVTGILIAIIIVKDYHAQNYYVTYQANTRGLGRRSADPDLQILDPSNTDIDLTAGTLQVENCDGDKCTLSKQKGTRFANAGQRSGADTMVFGVGVMLAWGAGFIMALGGGMMISQGCGGTTYEDEHGYNDGYSQGAPSTAGYNNAKPRNNEYL